MPGSAGAIGEANKWVSLGNIPAGHSTATQATPFYSSSRNVFFASDTSGVYRSIDGGDTFQERNAGLLDLRVTSLAVSPRFEFDLLVLASTPTGLYRSVDGAGSWTRVTAGLPEIGVTGVAFAPAFEANQTLFAATDGFGVYRSNDAGASWRSLPSAGLTRTDLKGVQVAPAGSGHVMIVVWSQSDVFRSRDSGATWKQKNSGLPGGRVIRFIALGPQFNSDGLALLGTRSHGIYRTKNKGDQWSSRGLTGKGAVETAAFSPNYGADNRVYAGTTTGGFFRSTNRGSSWEAANKGLDRHSITSISASNDFRSDRTLFAGGGQGGVFRSTERRRQVGWRSDPVSSPPESATLGFSNNYGFDGTLFVGTQSGVLKSENRGATWSNISWNLPSLRNPNHGGFTKLCRRSHDFRRTGRGTVCIGPSRKPGMPGSRRIPDWKIVDSAPTRWTVATSPVFHNTRGDLTVFVGGAGGVARSVLAGSLWVHVYGASALADVTSVVLSPNYGSDGTVFAASHGSGIFKSATRGQSWAVANNGLANLVVRQLAISPSYSSDGTLLAATDGGVFITRDGGQSLECNISIAGRYQRWLCAGFRVQPAGVLFSRGKGRRGSAVG